MANMSWKADIGVKQIQPNPNFGLQVNINVILTTYIIPNLQC